jgi:hypothetical protein
MFTTMDTVKATSLNRKISQFLHHIPGVTTVHLDSPSAQATTTSTKQLFENNSTTNKPFIILTPDSESSPLISPTLLILEPCHFF